MKRATPQPPRAGMVPLRTPSGRLIGYLDLARQLLEVKRAGRPAELIDMAPYLRKT